MWSECRKSSGGKMGKEIKYDRYVTFTRGSHKTSNPKFVDTTGPSSWPSFLGLPAPLSRLHMGQGGNYNALLRCGYTEVG